MAGNGLPNLPPLPPRSKLPQWPPPSNPGPPKDGQPLWDPKADKPEAKIAGGADPKQGRIFLRGDDRPPWQIKALGFVPRGYKNAATNAHPSGLQAWKLLELLRYHDGKGAQEDKGRKMKDLAGFVSWNNSDQLVSTAKSGFGVSDNKKYIYQIVIPVKLTEATVLDFVHILFSGQDCESAVHLAVDLQDAKGEVTFFTAIPSAFVMFFRAKDDTSWTPMTEADKTKTPEVIKEQENAKEIAQRVQSLFKKT